jgi:hypothetical protein
LVIAAECKKIRPHLLSLYRRFHQTGLTRVEMMPQFAAFDEPHTPLAQLSNAALLGALTAEETQEWHAGVAQAVTEGIYFIAQPFHCAAGTKAEPSHLPEQASPLCERREVK